MSILIDENTKLIVQGITGVAKAPITPSRCSNTEPRL